MMWTCLKVYQPEEGDPCLVVVGFTSAATEADAQLYAFASGNFSAPAWFLGIEHADGTVRIEAWAERSRVLDLWAWGFAQFPEALTARLFPILAVEPERGYGEKDVLRSVYAFEAETAAGDDNG